MGFRFNQFIENLKKADRSQYHFKVEKGIAAVVEMVWNQRPTAAIDFDSFTYEDVIEALEIMEDSGYIADEDEDSGEILTIDEDNPFFITDQVQSVIYSFYHFKNKIFEFEDEDLFI